VSTTSYPFMVLLNVAVFTVAGVLGLLFLLQTLHRLTLAQGKPRATSPETETDAAIVMAEDAALPPRPSVLDLGARDLGALDKTQGHVLGEHVKKVFWCWIVVFGLVGAQMGWVLRPFIGDPNGPFVWIRERRGNFFEAVSQTLYQLLSGG
jgi:hypothetical protein